MAFTGYVFDSAKEILSYLEEPKNGPSSRFCQEIAKTLGCYAAVGYPERLSEEELSLSEATPGSHDDGISTEGSSGNGTTTTSVDGALDPTHSSGATSDVVRFTVLPRAQVGANSAIIYGPSGEWVGGYRKTNLFETDITWAKPGTGFGTFSLPIAADSANGVAEDHVLDISLGICMDLNPHPAATWTREGGPYELADHCAKNKSRVLVLLNAWLFSGMDEEGEPQGYDKEEHDNVSVLNDVSGKDNIETTVGEVGDEDPDWYTLRYWTARLRPLWRRDGRRRGSNETIASDSGTDGSEEIEGEVVEEAVDEEELEEEKPPHETIVVVCNRTGKENGTRQFF
ncbi:hypothetical protein DXG03_004614 [Asterophora parasitica]|uniref:CN hydrolase domain-containing protein n=1 Tax=Asterophora parasitica TaxID=117018 RepID=A0A9P7GF41_9AGAR|nr:hypothetical protein DXG03_004614 [Asterophora parasitica]